ncbi:1-deoxy-D-xylulose-5-phosphate synthase [Aestuariimicrobium sp. Y1814]|uniref:1-deoxy-D-xylulose-5-phosphate synthase n=1 Tax=Aestuariimicrobium sp. Y1814 TaxID=3418742 RepID=UPI003DA709AD
MALLDSITAPSDLRALSKPQLEQLADEIREFLVRSVSRTGGHLGPNLGVVELTMAIHRIFDSPTDPIIFDTGHQSYVHKLLTGRRAGFEKLRQQGGLSGYPSREESEHDWVENSHASTSLSWAEGMAKAFQLRGVDRHVVAVIGDGALTGGMAWEALNNIAAEPDLPLVIIVNDNGRSYTPTIGGVANHLSALRTSRTYEQTLGIIKRGVSKAPLVGKPTYDMLHGIKTGIKDILAPQSMFSDLGLKYVGPIDGHDLASLELALHRARDFGGPVIVHCITQKGKGFRAAEENEEDQFHSVGKIDAVTGVPLATSVQATWTQAFAEEMVRIGADRDDVVAITAAMLHPTGLARFAAAYPDRTFDVGIAEQHAVASAAGMASAGLHPVIALYATFLNRAFDQLLMDVALHKLGVTIVLDRSGITGSDGASHNGMWDISLLGLVPGLRLAAPRDQERLVQALRAAIDVDDAPTVVRYSKERLPDPIPAVATKDGIDILLASRDPEVLVVGHGQFVGLALEVGHRLIEQGIGVRVVDPLWSLPINPGLVSLAGQHRLVVTVEDNVVVGGAGDQLAQALRAVDVQVPVMDFGIPDDFLPHASRNELLDSLGLSAQQISRTVIEKHAKLTGSTSSSEQELHA